MFSEFAGESRLYPTGDGDHNLCGDRCVERDGDVVVDVAQLTNGPMSKNGESVRFSADERPSRMEGQFRIERRVGDGIAENVNVVIALRESAADRSDPFAVSSSQASNMFVGK